MDRPVNFVGWHDCLHFANWLRNGKPTGSQVDGVTENGTYDFSGAATVEFQGPGTPGDPQILEAAGADVGLDHNGWTDNFAFDTLVVEAGAVVRLRDSFDNQSDGDGAVDFLDYLRWKADVGLSSTAHTPEPATLLLLLSGGLALTQRKRRRRDRSQR